MFAGCADHATYSLLVQGQGLQAVLINVFLEPTSYTLLKSPTRSAPRDRGERSSPTAHPLCPPGRRLQLRPRSHLSHHLSPTRVTVPHHAARGGSAQRRSEAVVLQCMAAGGGRRGESGSFCSPTMTAS